MKKIILIFVFLVLVITSLPANSSPLDGRHRHRVVYVNRWPRHRHVVMVYHRHHRHHRYYRYPPIWIPRDPWR